MPPPPLKQRNSISNYFSKVNGSASSSKSSSPSDPASQPKSKWKSDSGASTSKPKPPLRNGSSAQTAIIISSSSSTASSGKNARNPSGATHPSSQSTLSKSRSSSIKTSQPRQSPQLSSPRTSASRAPTPQNRTSLDRAFAAFKEQTAPSGASKSRPPPHPMSSSITPSRNLRTLDLNTMPKTSSSISDEWEVEQYATGDISFSASSGGGTSTSKRSLSPEISEGSPVPHKRLRLYLSPIKKHAKTRSREIEEEEEDDRMDADDELDLAGPSKIDWAVKEEPMEEMEVEEIPAPPPAPSIPSPPPFEDEIYVSDSESVDSEKALHRALNTDVRAFAVDDSDDDDFLEADLTSKRVKGPSTPTKTVVPSEESMRKLHQTLFGPDEALSPLTPATSDPISPTRSFPKSIRTFKPIQGIPYVEVPDYRQTKKTSPKKLPPPTVLAAPPKKSRKAGDALDVLLKEKKAHVAKKAKFLPSVEESSMELDNVHPASSPGRTAVGEQSPTPELATAEKLVTRMNWDASEDERNEQGKRLRAKMMRERSVFWLSASGDVGGAVPPFPGVEVGGRVLELLGRAYRGEDWITVTALLQTVGVTGNAPIPDEVFDWLLDAYVLHPDVSVSRAALCCLQKLFASGSIKDILLDFTTVRRLFKSLGASDNQLSNCSPPDHIIPDQSADIQAPIVSEARRSVGVERLLQVLRSFAETSQMDTADVPAIVMALLLMSQDALTTPDLRNEIGAVVAAVLGNLQSLSAKRSNRLELALCRSLASNLDGRFAAEAVALLSVIPRSDPVTIRVARWAALSHLRGQEILESPNDFASHPSMESIFAIFPTEEDRAAELQGAFSSKFAINGSTEWDELAACTDLLSIVMTDLDGYTREDNAVDSLIQAIGLVTSKIVEKTGINFEKTRAKGELQRLKVRLTYQTGSRTAISIYADPKSTKVQASLKSFFPITPTKPRLP